jgi:hypothetical protein
MRFIDILNRPAVAISSTTAATVTTFSLRLYDNILSLTYITFRLLFPPRRPLLVQAY